MLKKTFNSIVLTSFLSSMNAYSATTYIVFAEDPSKTFAKEMKASLIGLYKSSMNERIVVLKGGTADELCSIEKGQRSIKNFYRSCRLSTAFKTSSGGENHFSPQKLIDTLSTKYSIEKDDSLIIYATPFLSSPSYNFDMSKGFISLGYIADTKKAELKKLTPFYKQYQDYGLKGVSVHFLHPSDTSNKYVSHLTEGIGLHKSRIESFWTYYFNSFGMRLMTYEEAGKKLSQREKELHLDPEYEKSKDHIFYLDLKKKRQKSNPLAGQTKRIIEGYGKNNIKEGDRFQWGMPWGQIASVKIKEEDGDSDIYNNTVEVYGLTEKGVAVKLGSFTPSKNDSEKESLIEVSRNINDHFISIILKPLVNGKFNNLHGYWGIHFIDITYK